MRIDTDTLRAVAQSYDIVFGKPGEPTPTRRGDHVRNAASELDRLYAIEDATTPFKDRAEVETYLKGKGFEKWSTTNK